MYVQPHHPSMVLWMVKVYRFYFEKFQLPFKGLDTTISIGETFAHCFHTCKTFFNSKPELHHRMLAHQWLPLQLFFYLNTQAESCHFTQKLQIMKLFNAGISSRFYFSSFKLFDNEWIYFQLIWKAIRQLPLVCLLSVRKVSSISSEFHMMQITTLQFFRWAPNQIEK